MPLPQARKPVIPRATAYLFCAAVFAVLCAWVMKFQLTDPIFWDARVYARALPIFRGGASPYVGDISFGFVYPPAFLFLHRALAGLLPGVVGWAIYAALVVLSCAALPWLLATYFIRCSWFTPLLACVLYVLQPRLMGEISLLSGNLATPLYAVALAAAVPGLRRERWTAFYVAVLFSALLKPQYLALLLLPQLAGSGQMLWSAGVAVFAFAGYLAQALAMPALFRSFRSAVAEQVLGKGDVGFGIFSYLFKSLHRQGPAIAGHLILIGAGAAVMMWIKLRRPAAMLLPVWVPGILVLAILANPRLLTYDAQVAMLPAAFVSVEAIRAAIARGVNPGWIALPAAAAAVVLSQNGRAGVCVMLVLAMLAMLWQLWTVSFKAEAVEPS